MCESQMEDNNSMHSDDSNLSTSMKNKERLNALINMESKHSSVYYDLHSKNNILKADLENLYNSCKRFENKKKIKSEYLEEYYEKLMEHQKYSKFQLQQKLSYVVQQLEETNSLFYTAFDEYSSEILKNYIQMFNNKTQQVEKISLEITEQLNNIRLKSKISESLMKSQSNQISNIDVAINILFECSMKNPQIEIEECGSKLANEITKLEQKREEMKFMINKQDE